MSFFKHIHVWLFLITACTLNNIYAQDTCIYKKYFEAKDINFISCMDSVIQHARECAFYNEVPYYVNIWKYRGENDSVYVSFVTEPINYGELLTKELVMGKDWFFTLHKDIMFVCFFEDTNIFHYTGYDSIIINKEQWYVYEYMDEETKVFIPLRASETYSNAKYLFYTRTPCEDVKKRPVIYKSKNKVSYGTL